MLPTPKECLGPNFPLPTKADDKIYQPIWEEAFKIHANAHVGDTSFSSGIINAAYPESDTYCDCYIRAWLEVKYLEGRREVTPVAQVTNFYDDLTERVV